MPPRPFLPTVVAELEKHGIRPRPGCDPERVRAWLNDLYRIRLRRVRAAIRGEEAAARAGPRQEHGARVRALRDHYRLLALPARLWLEPEPGSEATVAPEEDRP